MKNVVLVFVAVLAFLSLFVPVKAIEDTRSGVEPIRWIVQDDGGGAVEEFKQSLKYMVEEKMAIRVKGMCASACTLVLSTDYKLDKCVEPDVVFGFHKPYASTPFGTIIRKIPFIVGSQKLWKEDFWGKYPEWVKQAIQARGEVPSVMQGDGPSEVLRLTYDDVKRFMRTCV